MRALKQWKYPNNVEIIEENHIILKRLALIDQRPFYNLKNQKKEFKKHMEIIENRRRWFILSHNNSPQASHKRYCQSERR